MKLRRLLLNLAAVLGVAFTVELLAQPSNFTYQGVLTESGAPANGIYDFRFEIYNAPDSSAPGVSALSIAEVDDVNVTNGSLTAAIPFESWVFSGEQRWLAVHLRTNDSGGYTGLLPWTEITPTPYAVRALNVTSNALKGDYGEMVSFSNTSNVFVGNGSGLTGVTLDGATASDFWQLGGNSGTAPSTHFIGTTDTQPLLLKVNNEVGLRLEPSLGRTIPNLVGGYSGNNIGATTEGGVIAGGGAPFLANSIGTNSSYSFIGAGLYNRIASNSSDSTIGGGADNSIAERSGLSFIGGGLENGIGSGTSSATVGGGSRNKIGTNSIGATIGGGGDNIISSNASYATIPGGDMNTATNYAFAGGRKAKAENTGAFVWADSTDDDFQSDRVNQFKIRAGGGMYVQAGSAGLNPAAFRVENTGSAGVAIHANQTSSDSTTVFANRGSGDLIKCFSGPTANNLVFQVQNDGDIGLGISPSHPIHHSSGARLTAAGVWTSVSDRNAKQDFAAIDPVEVLDKVVALPVSQWRYRVEAEGVRHIGPVAQDFHASFGLGESDTAIGSVDADGVALAAIQGLNQKLERENAELRKELREIKQHLLNLSQKGNQP